MLKPNQQQALALLLAGSTATDAAKAVGVTRQTVSEWKRLPAFREALEAVATEQAHEVFDHTMGAWRSAVRFLDAIVRDESPPIMRSEGVKGVGFPFPMRIDAARMVLAAGSRIAAAAVMNARRQAEDGSNLSTGLAEIMREARRKEGIDASPTKEE